MSIPYFSSVRNNVDLLKKELSNCKSVVDLGCGKDSNLKYLENNIETYGVDIYKKDLMAAKKRKTHKFFILSDILEIKKHFKKKAIDACVMMDVIEHLPKSKALKLIKNMEYISKKKIIITTPNGFLPQDEAEDGDYQKHVSGWTTEQMEKLGFRVYGINGLKFLRGELHRIKYKPFWFWVLVSFMSQKLWCHNHPKSAAAIFCVKNLK